MFFLLSSESTVYCFYLNVQWAYSPGHCFMRRNVSVTFCAYSWNVSLTQTCPFITSSAVKCEWTLGPFSLGPTPATQEGRWVIISSLVQNLKASWLLLYQQTKHRGWLPSIFFFSTIIFLSFHWHWLLSTWSKEHVYLPLSCGNTAAVTLLTWH